MFDRFSCETNVMKKLALFVHGSALLFISIL